MKIIEENATDTARLAAVRQVEIAVAPRLETRIERRTIRGAGSRGGGVPGAAVIIKRIKRGEIKAAAEPPVAHRLAVTGDKKADIGVAGRHIGIARMDDQRQTQRAEGATGELRPFFRGDGGQRGAVDDGNIHPALLNHRAVFQHHRHAVAAQAAVRTIALPNVAPERLAVFRRQGIRNAAL